MFKIPTFVEKNTHTHTYIYNMQHLEGSGTSVLYRGRRVPKG
jgi:hypothetical protein